MTIQSVGAGAVSKDGSQLVLSQSAIVDARVAGLMAYIKKPEFGPARLEAEGISFAGAAPAALAQNGSSISLEGRDLAGENIDIDSLYDGAMAKARKE